MKPYYDLCCIILNYNSSEDSLLLVNEIIEQKNINIRCVVVDNSSDESDFSNLESSLISADYKHVSLIRSCSNMGYASGNNFGFCFAIKHFDFEFLSIINPDIQIKNELFFSKFIEGAYQKQEAIDQQLGLVSCQISGNKHSGWSFPLMMTDLVDLSYTTNKVSEFVSKLLNNNLNSVDTESYDVITGCFFILTCDLFMEVGGFDNGTFLYCEERLLSKKIDNEKYSNIILSDFSIHHKNGGSITKSLTPSERVKQLIDSRYYFHLKYSKSPQLYYWLSRLLYSVRYIEELFIGFYSKLKK